MLDARAMAVGEQVTPTEFRALHCPHAIERTLLRSLAIPPLSVDGILGVFAQSLTWWVCANPGAYPHQTLSLRTEI